MSRKAATERANQKRRLALAELRSCGQCRECCTAMGVEDLPMPDGQVGKPAGIRCAHLQDAPAKGCGSYETRPEGCRVWKCVWLAEPDTLSGDERPDRLGAIFDSRQPGDMCSFQVVIVREARPGMFQDQHVREIIHKLASRGNLVLLISGPDGSLIVHDAFGPPEKVQTFWQEAEERQREAG